MKFPRDAQQQQVIRAFKRLGFVVLRHGNHIAMERHNPDGTKIPLTMPGHETIKSSTPGRSAHRRVALGKHVWTRTKNRNCGIPLSSGLHYLLS